MSGCSARPELWARASLGELFEVLDSQRVPVNAAERSGRAGEVPYYGATGQVGWIDEHLFDEELVLLGEDGAPFLQPDRPKAYVIRGKVWVNNHAHVLRAPTMTPAEFWKHQLDQVDYHPFVTGTTRLKLSQAPMLKIGLLVPPLSEQHRITDALSSYLSRIDEAVATLDRVQRNLKRHRASVLKAAVEGRLVPTEAALARAEGRDYEPASKLLERILAERRRRLANSKERGKSTESATSDASDLPELPEGWCWATMDQLLAGIEAGNNFRCEERPPGLGEVGVVKVSAVTWGTYDESESKTCIRAERVSEALMVRPGDFLFSRANTIQLVGACVVVGSTSKKLMLSDKILRFSILGGLERWCLFCLRSTWGRYEIESLATGNQESMRNIGQHAIRRIRVPLPPAAETRRIVQATEDSESMYSRSTQGCLDTDRRLARLRQSILKWAFEGKLVDQDPNDEPASVLLERIRAKRAAAAPATKPRAKKPRAKVTR